MRFTLASYGVGFKPIQVLKFDTERAGFTIQADSANSGIFYLSKDPSPSIENSFLQLAAGELVSGDYVGALYCTGTVAGDKIFSESFSKNVQESGLPAYQ